MDLTLQAKLGCALIGAGHLIVAAGIVNAYGSFYKDSKPVQDIAFGGFVGFLTMTSLIGVLQNT
jgi:hypothetical protein